GGSVDHLVGAGEELRRHYEAEQFRRLQIERQLELCRTHNRRIRRLCASKNASDVNTDLSVCVRHAGSVANKAAARDVFALCVNRGHSMACCKCDKLGQPAEEKWITTDEQCVGSLLGDGGKRRVDFCAIAGVQDLHRVPECASRFLHISQLERASREVRIYEYADRGSLRKQLVEQLQLLGYHSAAEESHPRNIAR